MPKSWRERCLSYPNLMFGRAVKNARDRALKRGLDFAIDREYVQNLFEQQSGLCYYSGIEMNIVKESSDIRIDPFKMTLDCIDSNLGYTKGNVVWCTYCVNSLKQKMTCEELLYVCESVVNHSPSIIK